MKDELWKLGACETATSIREGKITCLEVVQASADRLLQANPEINAVTVDFDGLSQDLCCSAQGRAFGKEAKNHSIIDMNIIIFPASFKNSLPLL